MMIECACCLKNFDRPEKSHGALRKYCSSKCSNIENQFRYFSRVREKLRGKNTPILLEQASTGNLEPVKPTPEPVRTELVLTQGEPITPVQRVVEAFKRITGHRNDRQWDKQFFKRYSASARRMIEYLGDYKQAVAFVTESYESLSNKGFAPFTMETLEKHMAPWKMDQLEKVQDE